MRLLSLAIVTALIAAFPVAAHAQRPTDEIKQRIDTIVHMLQDPKFRARPSAERRTALRRAADDIFDWTEMSKRALGPHWRDRTPAEREEFVRLFADVLERAYESKIEGYQGERIQYQGESVDGDHAVVRTTIDTSKGQSFPVDYRMLLEGGRWKVYDVDVGGVSLVSNYRAQFNDVIRRGSYAELVRRLKTKAEESEAASPASRR